MAGAVNGFLVCLGGGVVVVVVDDDAVVGRGGELVATLPECVLACFLASALVLTAKKRMPRMRAWHVCLDGARSNDAIATAGIDLQVGVKGEWSSRNEMSFAPGSDRNGQSDVLGSQTLLEWPTPTTSDQSLRVHT